MYSNLPTSTAIADLPPFCSASEVAALLRISRATAYRMATQGEIPCIRLGKRIIFSRDHLSAWIDKTIGGENSRGATHEGGGKPLSRQAETLDLSVQC